MVASGLDIWGSGASRAFGRWLGAFSASHLMVLFVACLVAMWVLGYWVPAFAEGRAARARNRSQGGGARAWLARLALVIIALVCAVIWAVSWLVRRVVSGLSQVTATGPGSAAPAGAGSRFGKVWPVLAAMVLVGIGLLCREAFWKLFWRVLWERKTQTTKMRSKVSGQRFKLRLRGGVTRTDAGPQLVARIPDATNVEALESAGGPTGTLVSAFGRFGVRDVWIVAEPDQPAYARITLVQRDPLPRRLPWTEELLPSSGFLTLGRGAHGLVQVELKYYPHGTVAAPTRSGKTAFFRNIAAQLYAQTYLLLGCDIKQTGLMFLEDLLGIEVAYEHDEITATLQRAYLMMTEWYRQVRITRQRPAQLRLAVLIDEWVETVDECTEVWRAESKDNTGPPPAVRYVGRLLRRGGECGIVVVRAGQRLDVKDVGGGSARAQAGWTVACGRMDRDGARMQFENWEEVMALPNIPGRGYVRVGTEEQTVQLPFLGDPARTNDPDPVEAAAAREAARVFDRLRSRRQEWVPERRPAVRVTRVDQGGPPAGPAGPAGRITTGELGPGVVCAPFERLTVLDPDIDVVWDDEDDDVDDGIDDEDRRSA
jgi:hypothetical protein